MRAGVGGVAVGAAKAERLGEAGGALFEIVIAQALHPAGRRVLAVGDRHARGTRSALSTSRAEPHRRASINTAMAPPSDRDARRLIIRAMWTWIMSDQVAR